MSEQQKPGETVKTSGIYKVVKEGNGAAFEVTCVEGEYSRRRAAAKARITSWFTRRRIRISTVGSKD
jgi:hypothetical protein